MPNRSSKPGPEDFAQTAYRVFEQAVGDHMDADPDAKNPAAVMLGRMGGLKGGNARAAKLTAEQRSEIAKKAASARWKKGQ
jgi:hypothetical protein